MTTLYTYRQVGTISTTNITFSSIPTTLKVLRFTGRLRISNGSTGATALSFSFVYNSITTQQIYNSMVRYFSGTNAADTAAPATVAYGINCGYATGSSAATGQCAAFEMTWVFDTTNNVPYPSCNFSGGFADATQGSILFFGAGSCLTTAAMTSCKFTASYNWDATYSMMMLEGF